MALSFQTKGKPIEIREVKVGEQYIFFIDFEEETNSPSPKGIPAPEILTSTALLNEKQFKRLEKDIIQNNDTLESINKLFIKGEIVNDLPNELLCSDIHYVGYEIQYIARKTKEVEGEENVKISLIRDREDQLEGKHNKVDSSLQRKVMVAHKNALHEKFEGQCQECDQRCDKTMMKVPESNPNTILCINCFNGWKEPTVKIGEKFLTEVAAELKMGKEEARRYLLNFPRTYALVDMHQKYKHKVYWSWDKTKPIFQIFVGFDGKIRKVLLKGGIALSPQRKTIKVNKSKSSEKKQLYVIKENKYEILNQKVMNLENITISDTFKAKTPNPKKVFLKVEYFKKHKRFDKPIVVNVNDGKMVLVDGYTRYIAAKNLGLSEVFVMEVKELAEEGVK